MLRPRNVRTVFIREVVEPLRARFPTPAGEIGFADGQLHSLRFFFFFFFCSQAFLGGARRRARFATGWGAPTPSWSSFTGTYGTTTRSGRWEPSISSRSPGWE
jgi:hypothetical protein